MANQLYRNKLGFYAFMIKFMLVTLCERKITKVSREKGLESGKFTDDKGWLQSFKKHINIKRLKVSEESRFVDPEKLAKKFIRLIEYISCYKREDALSIDKGEDQIYK